MQNGTSYRRMNSAMPSLANKNGLPFLPGHVFNNPYQQVHKKNQVFNFETNICTEKNLDLEHNKKSLYSEGIPDIGSINTFYNTQRLGGLRGNMTVYNESYPRILPQWIKYDKKVLKFHGYFNEHVVESSFENHRSRKVTIFYYLSDDSIHLNEDKTENSGIPQGNFVKRHRIERKTGKPINPNEYIHYSKKDYLHWSDFNLQSEVFLYGKRFRICDCDDFTKQFYNDHRIQLNSPEQIYEVVNEEDVYKISKMDFETNRQNIAESKEYIEVKLKGGHPNKNLKQFLENDRKVLNFHILWYDEKYDKEEKNFIMNFYLADNNIEIREIKVNNSGRDPFPYLLRKCKLPKKPRFSYCPGLLMKKDEYYEPKDLVLGNYINIYNRSCLIYDCDEFTKQWYKKK